METPCVHGLGDLKTVKMSVLPKVSYRFSAIPLKFPTFFCKKKPHPKIHMESQGTPNSQHNLGKEERS